MNCLRCRIRNLIHDFFHPITESVIKKFAIVEKKNITREEKKELLKILNEREKQKRKHRAFSKSSVF